MMRSKDELLAYLMLERNPIGHEEPLHCHDPTHYRVKK